MKASAWRINNGKYGIYVGIPNRDEFFNRKWTEVEIEVDRRLHRFKLTSTFWRMLPGIRDTEGTSVIRDWLQRNRSLDWTKGDPPRLELTPLRGNRFRLA